MIGSREADVERATEMAKVWELDNLEIKIKERRGKR